MGLRLSYSAVSSYENCPLSYRFQYVEHMEIEPSPYLSFGRSLHAALQWLYGRDIPVPPPLPDLLSYLEECWDSEGYSDPEEERSYLERARDAISRYYRENIAGFRLPLAVEHRFEMEMDGYTLAGVIDRIDRNTDGGYEIIDYKTNRKLPELSRLREDLQLPIYQIACHEVLGIDATKLTFHYLLVNRRYSTSPYDEQSLARVRERLRAVAEGVAAEEFSPTPNRLCPWCSYRDICPEMVPGKSKRDKFLSRRISLLRRKEALERMISELEEEMIAEGIAADKDEGVKSGDS